MNKLLQPKIIFGVILLHMAASVASQNTVEETCKQRCQESSWINRTKDCITGAVIIVAVFMLHQCIDLRSRINEMERIHDFQRSFQSAVHEHVGHVGAYVTRLATDPNLLN